MSLSLAENTPNNTIQTVNNDRSLIYNILRKGLPNSLKLPPVQIPKISNFEDNSVDSLRNKG